MRKSACQCQKIEFNLLMNPFHKAQTLKGDITRSSSLSPLLLLCLEISVPCLSAAFYLKSGILAYIFIIIAILPIIQIIFSYVYFMIKNPDALRSEKYNIEVKKMELLGNKDKLLNKDEQATKNPSLIKKLDE